MAVVHIGVCSWADDGLLKHWYPREVRTAEGRGVTGAMESVLLQAAVNAMVADRMPRNMMERMEASMPCRNDSMVCDSIYAAPSRERTSY